MSKLPKHLYYGNLAIEYGFLKPEQVNACLAKQQELRGAAKKAPPLGKIAIDSGMLSRHQAKLLAHIQKELVDQHEAATPTVVAEPSGGDPARASGRLSLSVQHKRDMRRRLSLKLKAQAHQRRIAVYLSGSGLILLQQLFKLL